jgi:hypothetical protein
VAIEWDGWLAGVWMMTLMMTQHYPPSLLQSRSATGTIDMLYMRAPLVVDARAAHGAVC